MAWASKKQYAILMSSEEGKDLAEQLGEMEQDEFNKKFSELLGKSGESTSEAKENSNKDNEEEAKKQWLEENGYESEDEIPWWDRDDNEDEYDDDEQPKEKEVVGASRPFIEKTNQEHNEAVNNLKKHGINASNFTEDDIENELDKLFEKWEKDDKNPKYQEIFDNLMKVQNKLYTDRFVKEAPYGYK